MIQRAKKKTPTITKKNDFFPLQKRTHLIVILFHQKIPKKTKQTKNVIVMNRHRKRNWPSNGDDGRKPYILVKSVKKNNKNNNNELKVIVDWHKPIFAWKKKKQIPFKLLQRRDNWNINSTLTPQQQQPNTDPQHTNVHTCIQSHVRCASIDCAVNYNGS